MLDPIHDGIGDDPGASRLRGAGRDAAVILRGDRTDRLAIVVAATGRAAVIGTAVACGRVADDLIAARGEPLTKSAHRPWFGDGLHGEGLHPRRAGVRRAGYAQLDLGLLVVGLEL